MPPKASAPPTASKVAAGTSPRKSVNIPSPTTMVPASPGPAGNSKFNLVLCVKQIFVFKEAIKQAKESGIFTDKEQKKVNEKNQKVAEMKKSLAKELAIVTASRKGKTTPITVEGEDELATVEDFFEGLIIDTDIVPGNVELVKAFMSCVALDYPTLCEQRGLVVAAIQDGSQQYLTEFLTFSSPAKLKLDPTELFPAAFFNQQFRIPLVSLLLKHEANMDMAAAADELADQWNEFIADIAAKKRAIAREDRNNRLPLLQLMMSHKVVKYKCDAEGGDGHTVFSRAVSEADLPLLEMMQKNGLCPNINRINGDGRTALMHAVIANSLEVVRFLLKFDGIDIYVESKTSGEGTAMDLAKALKRDMSIVTALGGAMRRQAPAAGVAEESFCGATHHMPLTRKQSIAKKVELKLDVGEDSASNPSSPTRHRSFKFLGPDIASGGGVDDAKSNTPRLPLLQKLMSIRAKGGNSGGDAAALQTTQSQPNSGRGGGGGKNLGWVDDFSSSPQGSMTMSQRGSIVFNSPSSRHSSLAGVDAPKPGPNQKLLNEVKYNLATGAYEANVRVVDKPPAKQQACKSPRLEHLPPAATPPKSDHNGAFRRAGDISLSPSVPRGPQQPSNRPPAKVAPLPPELVAPRSTSPQSKTLHDSLPTFGTVSSGTLNSGTMNSGTMNSGTMKSGTINSGTINSARLPAPVPVLHPPNVASKPSSSAGPVNVMELINGLISARSIITHRASVGIVSEFEEEKQEQRVSHVGKDYMAVADKICRFYSKDNIYVPPEDDDYLKLQEFLSALIGEGDSDPGKLKLVEALISRCDLDISIVSDMNALVATAAGDGSIGYLKALLDHPDTKFDPAEAIMNAMFNTTMRVPAVLTLLRYPQRMEFPRLKLDKHFVAAWHEFFADIACRKRANPSEDQTGRMELLKLMLGNTILPADPTHIDSDQLDVFCRAAHDGDVELLKLLISMHQVPNINKVYGDGTTVLIHAVFSNDSKTVELVLGMPKVDPNVETENGTALAIATGLNRPKTLINLLVQHGATAGMTASRIVHVPELSQTQRNKTARSLWDEAMDSEPDDEE